MHESDFKIAIITALPIELSCMEGMLDEQYEDLPQSAYDHNTYTYGRIGKHNVVLACLPAGEEKVVSAANVAGRIINSFPKFRFGLMVGIAGGVSDMETDQENDVRLGDIVVSKPSRIFGGVVQYNQGKVVASGTHTSTDQGGDFVRTGALRGPPDELLSAISKLESKRVRLGSDVPRYLSEMFEKYPRLKQLCPYPGVDSDLLFEAEYDHQGRSRTCRTCDASRLVNRPARIQHDPVVHYGTIASDNQLIKHGITRDRIAKGLGALCFEMEAAGLMNDFPCLVVRGICDYADSHKNKNWQPYASAVAAAYAKELLYTIPTERVDRAPIHNERNDFGDINQCVQCRFSQTADRRFEFWRSRICGDLVCSDCHEKIVQKGQEQCARSSCQKVLHGFDYLLDSNASIPISSVNQSQMADTRKKPQTTNDRPTTTDSSENAQLQPAKYICTGSLHVCRERVSRVSFSQNGQISVLKTGSRPYDWYVWKPWQTESKDLKRIRIDPISNYVTHVQPSRNGKSLILLTEGGCLYLRQIQLPLMITCIGRKSDFATMVTWSWHDEMFATWGSSTVNIWKYTGSDWKQFLSFCNIPGLIHDLTFSGTNHKLACVGTHGLFFLDFATQSVRASSLYSVGEYFSPTTLTLSPDGTLVAHLAPKREVILISDAESGKDIYRINNSDIRQAFFGMAVFSSDNKKIAVASRMTWGQYAVSIWNIETATFEVHIEHFTCDITALTFIPNTANIAIGLVNGQINMYKASESGPRTV